MDPSRKLDLMEKGTRWEHYAELLELFASGVDVLKNIKVKTPGDRLRQVILQHAVAAIEGRLNFITDFNAKTGYGSSLRDVIDGEVTSTFRKMQIDRKESEAHADATKNSQDPEDDNSDSPASYTTK